MAMVMQLRKMMTNTMWSNILWVMILLHRPRNLTENTERWETSGKWRWIWQTASVPTRVFGLDERKNSSDYHPLIMKLFGNAVVMEGV